MSTDFGDIVCPYCDSVQTDEPFGGIPEDGDYQTTVCEDCNKTFKVTADVDITVEYDTEEVKQPDAITHHPDQMVLPFTR